MLPLRRLAEQLRLAGQLSPARPALAAGLRAGCATTVPLLVGMFAGLPATPWAGLGGFLVALADKGGSYPSRAATMGTLVATATVSSGVASAIGTHRWLPIPLMLVWGVACGLAPAWGLGAMTVGVATAVTFAASLATPAVGVAAPLERSAYVLAGGLWAMVLALVLWPLRPYRPARLAVGACYRALAACARDVAAAFDRAADDAAWHAVVVRHSGALREAVERARIVLAATRRGRPGESRRGERLLVLLENADQLFPRLIALAEVLETAAPEATPEVRRAEHEALLGCAATADEVAAAVEREARSTMPYVDWGAERLRGVIATPGAALDRPGARAVHEHAAALFDRLHESAVVAAETVAGLADESAPASVTALPARTAPPHPPRESLLAPLRANLTWTSLVFRHALRLGVTAAAAVAVARSLGLAKAHWATLAVIVILQPHQGPTVLRGMQRIGGTIVGGILTALIAAVVHDPRGILVLAFLFSGVSIALLPINYGVFSALLTPPFVLLAEVNAGDWHLASVRIVNTLIGGTLALAATRLLWPSPERDRFPEELGAAVRANADYLALVAGRRDSRAVNEAALSAARRRVGLATLNAEASFQRLLTEVAGAPGELEPVMAILTYLRRFAASVTAIAALPDDAARSAETAALSAFAHEAGAVLTELARGIAEGRPPGPNASLSSATEPPGYGSDAVDPAFAVRISRAWRQLAVLHAAASRVARSGVGEVAAE